MLTCPCASRCGGCDKISVPYEETLREKQAYISSLLSRFGDPLPILSMQNPYYYRNKVHRVFARNRSGRLLCGNYKAGTHQVVEVDACLIEDKASQRVIRTVRNLAASFRIPVYDEDRETGLLRHVLVRRGFATGELLVVLVMTSPVFPGKNNFVRALLQAHPEITSLVLNINARHTTMVLGEKNVTLHGPGYIRDTLCGLTFRISPTSFYQINPVQTEKLYATAVGFAGLSGRETVLDAYCGIGTIGLSAASRAGHVTGVELNRAAVADARINARENGITNVEFLQGDAGDFLVRWVSSGKRPDVLMLDPPRAGSTEKFLSSCLRAAPERIVYVSCDPETLRRDLLFLARGHYRVEKIQPVDMFPFTRHVETVCCLYRQKKDFISVPYDPKDVDYLKINESIGKSVFVEKNKWIIKSKI